MPAISLKVTHAPSGALDPAVSEAAKAAKPLFRGAGDTDYLCGNCGAVIALGIGPTQRVPFDSTICSACGAENEFPRSLRG
jgi:hypothetical protein